MALYNGDGDEHRLPHGMHRVGYDVDTEKYTFQDKDGSYWVGPEGAEYGQLRQVENPKFTPWLRPRTKTQGSQDGPDPKLKRAATFDQLVSPDRLNQASEAPTSPKSPKSASTTLRRTLSNAVSRVAPFGGRKAGKRNRVLSTSSTKDEHVAKADPTSEDGYSSEGDSLVDIEKDKAALG